MTWWQTALACAGGIVVTLLGVAVLAALIVNAMIWLDLRLHRDGRDGES